MTSCYVCDKEVTDEIYLTSSETFFSKTIFLNKISELMGSDFMVVAAEEDQLCKRCASLLNKSDKLEVDLMEIHNVIKRFLDFKYNLVPKEDHWNQSETEYSKIENDSRDLETEDFHLKTTGPSFNDDENISPKSQTNGTEIQESPLISEPKIKSEPRCSLAEGIDNEVNKTSDAAALQTPPEEKLTVKVKLEHNSGEDTCSFTSDQIVYKDHKPAHEEKHSHMTNEALESNKETISVNRDFKSTGKSIKKSSKKKLDGDFKLLKNRPILPKIVKSIDILKLASLGVFEPIDPSNIIQITACSTDQPVEVGIPEQSVHLEIPGANYTQPEQNITIIEKKRDSHNVFKCDICGKECSTNNRLEMHKTVHEKKICDFCGRAFTSNYRLKVHRNIHTKQKKYTCNVCGESFIHHSTYWYHRKWHDEPYPYSCEFCGKLFKHSSILAIHRRKHTGERPYKCSYCPLTFTISTTMKKHEMLHTNEYTFTCDVCQKGFTTRSKYVYHMARNHKVIDESNDVTKQRKKPIKIKSDKKKMTQSSSNSNIELVEVDDYKYIPLELQEGIEVVVGPEQMKKYKDISIEVINQDNPQLLSAEQDGVESVATDQYLPVELDEGVFEIVLGPDEYVLSEDMIIS